MVRRVVALQRTTPDMSILAPHLSPIRTRLTPITSFPRCTPHSTVAHAPLSLWQAKCARSAGGLLIIFEVIVRSSRRCGRQCAARCTAMPPSSA
eukprot:scaffold5487_cov67-Phaeocystis_antarctica.AAC.5